MDRIVKRHPIAVDALVVALACLLVVALSVWFGLYLKDRHYFEVEDPHESIAAHKARVMPNIPLYTQPRQQSATNLAVAPDYSLPPVTDGLAPVLISIPTKQNIVFLGIDDGANKQDFELELLQNNNIKATLFLADEFIKDKPSFFKKFMDAGYPIENHTLTHRLLSKLTYEQQKHEICGEADRQLQQFGRRPVLFRPPGGDYNQDTRRAAADCGMKALINWVAKANGGSMQYQVGNTLRPGDIVLMHFRPEFAADLQAFLDAQQAAGLHTELLEDWL